MSVTPAGINGLLDLVASLFPGMQLLDGPAAEWPNREFVAVGLGPSDLETRAQHRAAGPATTGESAEVTCLIRGWSGNTAMRPRRDRTYQILGEIVAAIERDNTLGGRVGIAEVIADTYVPSQSTRGALADLVFTVQVRKF